MLSPLWHCSLTTPVASEVVWWEQEKGGTYTASRTSPCIALWEGRPQVHVYYLPAFYHLAADFSKT